LGGVFFKMWQVTSTAFDKGTCVGVMSNLKRGLGVEQRGQKGGQRGATTTTTTTTTTKVSNGGGGGGGVPPKHNTF
jgi:hypothetical protein